MLLISVVYSFCLCSTVYGTHMKRQRTLFEDPSLPFPISTHTIEQNEDSRLQQKRIQHGRQLKSELTPLYPGYGTHFSYIYVGTPPQRQSVIVDTGSRYTAFPCTGCSQCGKHTDNYWDVKNSSTAKIHQCNNQPCQISQSYSEGSMWKGFRVMDKIFVGGLTDAIIPQASAYALNFTFVCQTFETGLFRTQLADGIMGMSMSEETLPSQLQKAGLSDTKIFALCYRTGGGIMTLGGVDQRIHTFGGASNTINYAQMINQNGWYGVKLLGISLEDRGVNKLLTIIPGVSELVNRGKGCIVDSGTTDTYFPSSLLRQFAEVFQKVSGVAFNSNQIKLTPELLTKIPNIVFTFQSATKTMNNNNSTETFTVTMPWSNYLDSVGDGKYAFRVYLSEPSGFILGANFMNGYNIIFDSDGKRIGFAKSACKYTDYVKVPELPPRIPKNPPLKLPPVSIPSKNDGNTNRQPTQPTINNGNSDTWNNNKNNKCPILPVSSCSAFCDYTTLNTAVVKEGVQTWINSCSNNPMETRNTTGNGQRACHINCYGPKLARGTNLKCPDKPWGECTKACVQVRVVSNSKSSQQITTITNRSTDTSISSSRSSSSRSSGITTTSSNSSRSSSVTSTSSSSSNNSSRSGNTDRDHQHRHLADACAYTTQTRVCFTGACPVSDGDYLVFVDMKVRFSPSEWSYVHKEAFFAAFAKIFKVSEGSVDLLNDANSEYTNRVKLRFEMRLNAKSYTDIKSFTEFAENIPNYVKTIAFKTDLIDSLSEASEMQDHLDYSRYGWLKPADIDITNVIVLPKGSARGHIDENRGSGKGSVEAVTSESESLHGIPTIDLIILGIALGAITVLCIVVILYFRLRREHAALEKDKVMGGSLRRMWDKFVDLQPVGRNSSSGRGGASHQGYRKLNMNEFSTALEKGKLSGNRDTMLDMDDDNNNGR